MNTDLTDANSNGTNASETNTSAFEGGSGKKVIREILLPVAILLFAGVIVCIVWIFIVVSGKLPQNADAPFQLVYFAARLMQLTIGMLIGLALTVLGVMTAWFGVTQDPDVNLESSVQNAKLFYSHAPGALLVVCGTAIIMYCISLKLELTPGHMESPPKSGYNLESPREPSEASPNPLEPSPDPSEPSPDPSEPSPDPSGSSPMPLKPSPKSAPSNKPSEPSNKPLDNKPLEPSSKPSSSNGAVKSKDGNG